MRVAVALILLTALTACKTQPDNKPSDYAEIDAYLAPGCEQPSVRFRELQDNKARKVSAKQLPVRVVPGVYSIGLSCGQVFDEASNNCIEPQASIAETDVPTYKLVVNPKVRYLFRCLQVNGVWTYHMTESAF